MSTLKKIIREILFFLLSIAKMVAFIWLAVVAIFLVIFMVMSEHTTIIEKSTIQELNKNVLILPDTQSVHKEFNGKTVYAQGKVETQNLLSHAEFGAELGAEFGAEFGIEAKSLGLKCTVHYYQWHLQTGTDRTFMNRYIKKWKSYLSDVKGKDNTLIADYHKFKIYTKDSYLGAYSVSEEILSTFPMPFYDYAVQLSWQQMEDIQKTLIAKAQNRQEFSESLLAYDELVRQGKNPSLVHMLLDGTVYLGLDPQNPRIGDIQLSFSVAPHEIIMSAIVQQNGNTLEPYKNEHGEIITSVIESGEISLPKLLSTAQFSTSDFQWVSRIVIPCIFAVIFGIYFRISGKRKDFLMFYGKSTWYSKGLSMLVLGIFAYVLIFILIYGSVLHSRYF